MEQSYPGWQVVPPEIPSSTQPDHPPPSTGSVSAVQEPDQANRRRELNAAARESDPTLGGFATLEACGPDVVADDAAPRT